MTSSYNTLIQEGNEMNQKKHGVVTPNTQYQEKSTQEVSLLSSKVQEEEEEKKKEEDAPEKPPKKFICPLTKRLFEDPMISIHGYNFERCAILEWIVQMGNNTCPISGKELHLRHLVADETLYRQVRQWKADHGLLLPSLINNNKDKHINDNTNIYGFDSHSSTATSMIIAAADQKLDKLGLMVSESDLITARSNNAKVQEQTASSFLFFSPIQTEQHQKEVEERVTVQNHQEKDKDQQHHKKIKNHHNKKHFSSSLKLFKKETTTTTTMAAPKQHKAKAA